MPMLAGMIKETPRVYAEGGFVQVDVISNGHVVERVAMSPHLAMALSELLRTEAVRLFNAGPGATVIPLREAEG